MQSKSSFPSRPSLSPFVTVAFVVLSATGLLLFFHVKNGPIVVLHEWFGWAFVVAGVAHLLLNLRALLGYLKQKSGFLSLALALALTLGLTVAGLNHRHGTPPFRHPSTEAGND